MIALYNPYKGGLTRRLKREPERPAHGPQINFKEERHIRKWAAYHFGEVAGRKFAQELTNRLSWEHKTRQTRWIEGLKSGINPIIRLAEQLGMDIPPFTGPAFIKIVQAELDRKPYTGPTLLEILQLKKS